MFDFFVEQGVDGLMTRVRALLRTEDQEGQKEVDDVLDEVDQVLAAKGSWLSVETHSLIMKLTMHVFFRFDAVECMEVQYACEAVANILDALRFLTPTAAPNVLERGRRILAKASSCLDHGEDEVRVRHNG